jgi:riboflavin kinase/FMN adenylyltransferase
MKILHSIERLSELKGPVMLSIGVFDGVHIGHQVVLRQSMTAARQAGGTSVALTFDPHPARVLRPECAPRLLTSTAHKARLIQEVGLENLLIVRFDPDFAQQPPEVFIRRLAGECRPLRQIAVGQQWAFGRGRSGNVELLRVLGTELGFDVVEVPSVVADGETISSTRIREAVERGDLATAKRLLGRDYTIFGTVESGDRLGRTIGFPTANLRAHNEQFPPDGVYAVRVQIDSAVLRGVANIGYRPTVASSVERKLEVHILDFSGDLYGRDLDVDFIAFLRGERKFDGLDALKAQIAADVEAARALLG